MLFAPKVCAALLVKVVSIKRAVVANTCGLSVSI